MERTCTVLTAGPLRLPLEVLAATRPGPAVVVRVAEAGRTTALIVAAPARREVEVFRLADPDLGYPEGFVVSAVRFRDVEGRAFQDRVRTSPAEDASPDQRIRFRKTLLYREPGTVVHREELEPGRVHEHVDDGLDLSGNSLPWPRPGDWAPFVGFRGP